MWVIATVAAAGFQVARNSMQRALLGNAGPWGATLARFLFGFPFSLLLTVAILGLRQPTPLNMSAYFWMNVCLGAAAQILATAALLVSMHRASFAVGTAVQQSSIPMSAVLGLIVYGDRLATPAWIGIAITTVSLVVLSWPRGAVGERPVSGVLFGLLSGLAFALALNAFRQANLALSSQNAATASLITVSIVQFIQILLVGVPLFIAARPSFTATLCSWRTSLSTGLCAALASTGWFVALALAPAGPVRSVGVIEVLFAAIVGRRVFQERSGIRQLAGYLALAVGITLTVLR